MWVQRTNTCRAPARTRPPQAHEQTFLCPWSIYVLGPVLISLFLECKSHGCGGSWALQSQEGEVHLGRFPTSTLILHSHALYQALSLRASESSATCPAGRGPAHPSGLSPETPLLCKAMILPPSLYTSSPFPRWAVLSMRGGNVFMRGVASSRCGGFSQSNTPGPPPALTVPSLQRSNWCMEPVSLEKGLRLVQSFLFQI